MAIASSIAKMRDGNGCEGGTNPAFGHSRPIRSGDHARVPGGQPITACPQCGAAAYLSGGLEEGDMRAEVCDILEGGEQAFRERARRLRVRLER
jgi:hypothetical protein